VLAAAVLAGPAHARTFTVDSTADQSDQAAGDGVCDTSDLECTLRAAVEEANAFTGDPSDAIVVPAGTYDLSSALLPVTDMQITGSSPRTTVVNQTGIDRVFDIASGATVGISRVTLSGGTANISNNHFGGNLRAQDSDVTLTDSTITDGTGDSGGGLSNVSGTMTVRNSTITGNSAPTDPLEGGDAGAIQNTGGTETPATLTVQNSTITGNSARLGAGILGGGNSVITVTNSTIVGNSPTGTPRLDLPNGGGLTVLDGSATVSGSIIAGNTSPAPATPNCASDPDGQFGAPPGTIGSAGGNVESGTDCGFVASGDLQSSDPQLGVLADNGGPTDTHALSPTSPARDRGGAANCPSTDQRGAPRPQGSACDSGAYEFSVFPGAVTGGATEIDTAQAKINGVGRPEGQPTAFRFQFGTTSAYGNDVPASGGSPSGGSQPMFATLLGLESDTTYHYRLTAASPAGSVSGADRTFTTLKTLEDLPAPRMGKTTNVEPVSGIVFVALPLQAGVARAGKLAQKGRRFIPLTEARQIPVGSLLDTERGRVRLQTARAPRGKQRQSGQFFSGLFQVLQSRSRSAKGLTELRLKGSSFSSCKARPRGRRATASASRRIRRLGSNARGRFRTRGRHSAATVRGTRWTTTDRCDGTLTTVQRGSVTVRDFRRKKTIVVRAGKSYLARAQR